MTTVRAGGVGACLWTTIFFVCVRTSGLTCACLFRGVAELTVGPVRPRENASPPSASTATNPAAMNTADRLFIVLLLLE